MTRVVYGYEVASPNVRMQVSGYRVWGDPARYPSHIDTSGMTGPPSNGRAVKGVGVLDSVWPKAKRNMWNSLPREVSVAVQPKGCAVVEAARHLRCDKTDSISRVLVREDDDWYGIKLFRCRDEKWLNTSPARRLSPYLARYGVGGGDPAE
jgi:hypothetical protein